MLASENYCGGISLYITEQKSLDDKVGMKAWFWMIKLKCDEFPPPRLAPIL